MHAAFQPCSGNLISVANSDAGLGKAALWLDENAPTVGAAQLVFTCSERHPSVFILNEILESLSKSVLKHLFKIESYFHSLRLVILCYSSIALYFVVLLLLSLFFKLNVKCKQSHAVPSAMRNIQPFAWTSPCVWLFVLECNLCDSSVSACLCSERKRATEK